MNIGAELLVILGLTLVNGLFSAAEVGLLSVRTTRLEQLAAKGSRGAGAALKLRAMPERLLATIQVGITVISATAAAFGGATLEEPITAWLVSLGLSEASAGKVALALVVCFISLVSIVIGELVPKSVALKASERVSTTFAPPLLVLARIARPVVWLLTALSNAILWPFRDETSFTESRMSPEELLQLVEESATTGSLNPAAGDIASRAIELSKLQVVALLVPRSAVVSIPLDASAEQVWEVLKAQPHARYPVTRGTLDEVEGYVVARDLVQQLIDTKSVSLATALREVPALSERMPAAEALRTLQKQRTQLAIVVDDQGLTAGIVTVGDIAEELLGELLDEHDRPQQQIRSEPDGSFRIRADAPVQQVNRALGIDLPISVEYTSIAGLLLHLSGRILQPGERVTDIPGCVFEVVEATQRQIKVVRLTKAVSEDSVDSVDSVDSARE